MNVPKATWRYAVCIAGGVFLLGLLQAQQRDTIPTPARIVAVRNAGGASTPPAFTQGRSTPAARMLETPATAAMHEIAQLTREASVAFDRGDMEMGRKKAQLAVEMLAEIEEQQRGRGNNRAASRLAMQRGRIHMDMLSDPMAATEAYADAVIDDEGNKEAPLALQGALVRAHAEGGDVMPGLDVTSRQ